MINIYNKSRGKCKEKGMIINMSRELFERLEEMDVEVKDTIERLMGDEELYTEYLTSKMYARTFFEEYDVDALTVAPYMGEDSVTPFLGYDGKWVILLALTSNKGSNDFQLTDRKSVV